MTDWPIKPVLREPWHVCAKNIQTYMPTDAIPTILRLQPGACTEGKDAPGLHADAFGE